ncbi:MAG: MBL fold metallo-hydrolase [Vicinamibacterales bacterium]|nr:MBL fold metallo-hydrolase [Vicinamibacterales bacterium]
MSLQARVTFLGTGTSHGVPMIGCTCAVCRSDDPRDRRMRPSIHLQVEGGPAVLVDTSTDLRQQALTFGITAVDAILYTHSHADHVLGLDEVRRFNMLKGGTIPAWADAATVADLQRMFAYVFDASAEQGGGIPQMSLTAINGAFGVGPLAVQPVPLMHGPRAILGFRFGRFAYLTDCNYIPDEAWPLLEGLDLLVLDALRHRPHPTHFTVEAAVEAATRIGAARTYFTHICHDLPHEATCRALPESMELAYDGLVVNIDAGTPWK